LDYVYKVLIIIALLVTAAILCRDIIVPVSFAAIFSVVMLPLVKRIEKKTGTTWAVVIVLLGSMVIFGFLGWLLVNQIINLVNDLPNLETKTDQFIDEASTAVQQNFHISLAEQKKMIQDFLKGVTTIMGTVLLTTSSTISTLIQ